MVKKFETIFRFNIKRFFCLGGNTNTGKALSFGLYTALLPSNGARSYIPKAALVLTDGRSQDLVGNPAREMRQAGVKVRSIIWLCKRYS